jgi:hypothetical protein
MISGRDNKDVFPPLPQKNNRSIQPSQKPQEHLSEIYANEDPICLNHWIFQHTDFMYISNISLTYEAEIGDIAASKF